MSIIYSYPTTSPTLDDLLIGTDVGEDNATKSFTVQSLVSLINAAAGTGTVTDITISTVDVFLTATKTSQPGASAVTYTVGLTSLPSVDPAVAATQFLRGDNTWTTPTVSAGISVFGNGAQLITNDVNQFSFIGGGVSTTAGANGSVTVEVLEQTSDVNSVIGRDGISVSPASGQGDVIVTNSGVTQITTGTGLTATRGGTAVTTGNILLSLDGNAVGAGTVTSVFAGPGLRIQSGLATVSPTLAVQYTGAQNVIAQGLNAAVVTQSDQILFNQVSSTPANVKSTTLGTIPMDSLPLVKEYIDSSERGFVSNLADTFDTAVAKNIVTLEQSQYNGITTKDPNTLYFTTGVVVVPTETRLAIDVSQTSNIINNTGVTPIPVTFSGDQPYSGTGSTRTGQPGATIAPAYSSNIVIDTALYAWENGVVPVITNATGVYPATGFSTVASTFSAATLILKPATQNTSTLNTTFGRTFTLDGNSWSSAPANLITATYNGSPAVDPSITGAAGTNYSNSTQWNVNFTYSGTDYVMSNETITYDPVQGNYDGGTVDVALTADFVTATASGTPSVVIQDLVNTDQGAQRNIAYEVQIYPNPETGGYRYIVPASTTGETITIPITHPAFLTVGTTTTFNLNATSNSVGTPPASDYQFINPVSQYATATTGPGNTADFEEGAGGGTNALTIASTGNNIASFTISGDTAIKTGSSTLTSVGFNVPYGWNGMTPGPNSITSWPGQWKTRAQYRLTPDGGAAGSWIATAFSTGGTFGSYPPLVADPPVFPTPSIQNINLNTTVEWRYEVVFSSELTTQLPFVISSTSSPAGNTPPDTTDFGPQTALNLNGQSTGANNTGASVSYITPVIASHYVHLSNVGSSTTPTSIIKFDSGKFIENLTYIQNGISPAQNSAVNACCDVTRQSDLYYNLGSGSATSLLGATLYSDALGLNVLPSNFYQVAGSSSQENASIHIDNSNGIVTTGKTVCAACVTLVRYPIQLIRQGPINGTPYNGSFSSEVDANRSASYIGYQRNAFNTAGLGNPQLTTVWLQKGTGNTDTTKIESGDGVFRYSNTSDPSGISANTWWATSGSAATNTLDQAQAFFMSGSGSQFGNSQVTSVSDATYTMVELVRSNASGTPSGACAADLDPPIFILKNGANFNASALQNLDLVFGNIQRTNLLTAGFYYKVNFQTSAGAGGAPVVGRFYLPSGSIFQGVGVSSVNNC